MLYIGRKEIKNIFKTSTEWIIITIAAIMFILFSLFNLKYLPVIDFLPYETSVKIADKMVIPEGAPIDEYQTTFIYEKDNVKKEFTLNDYPANDTTWRFIDQKSILLKKGYQPPIHDFSIKAVNGEDLTEKILSSPGYSLLMVSKKLPEADKSQLFNGFELGEYCRSNGIEFYVLTASGTEELKNYENQSWFCFADETTLKTMIRANPGYILLKNGTIAGKWSWANVPEKEWFGRLEVQTLVPLSPENIK
jgi:hypothetical protein